jgi:hypothetical protein
MMFISSQQGESSRIESAIAANRLRSQPNSVVPAAAV